MCRRTLANPHLNSRQTPFLKTIDTDQINQARIYHFMDDEKREFTVWVKIGDYHEMKCEVLGMTGSRDLRRALQFVENNEAKFLTITFAEKEEPDFYEKNSAPIIQPLPNFKMTNQQPSEIFANLDFSKVFETIHSLNFDGIFTEEEKEIAKSKMETVKAIFDKGKAALSDQTEVYFTAEETALVGKFYGMFQMDDALLLASDPETFFKTFCRKFLTFDGSAPAEPEQ